jgi:hypothetical protein
LIKHIRTNGHEDLSEEYDRLEEVQPKSKATPNKSAVKRKLNEISDSPLKTLDGHVTKHTKYDVNSSAQNERRTKMVVKCMLPITLVDNLAFRDYINYMDPSFTVPQSYTVKHTVLKELSTIVYEKLSEKLDSLAHINVALDLWSDATSRVFQWY